VEVDQRGFVSVDGLMRPPRVPGVYAVGDLVGHAASWPTSASPRPS